MINNLFLVGRIVETPTVKHSENGLCYTLVTLVVARPFKNSEGKYDYDFIPCLIWDALANSTCEYCRKGDTIGIRGRLVSRTKDVTFNGVNEEIVKRLSVLEVIAERVFFVQVSGKSKEEIPIAE